nr:MAG TPA: hypothetical protein [Caudoviricetes sp.]
MTSPTATITGRVVGPDGLGRMGRVTFRPATPTAGPPAGAVLVGQASFRIDPDGYLVGPGGRSVTILPGDYEIDLNIPGDSGAHIRRRATISAGQALTLADLLTAAPPTPPTPPTPPNPPAPQPPTDGILTPEGHEIRRTGSPDVLEAANPAEIVDLGSGVLTWRRLDGGLVRPGGRGVRDADTTGILEAMDRSAVIDLGNGELTWR